MTKRPALRSIPSYDPTTNIGAVDRIRWAIGNNRKDALTVPELEQLERWKQINDWIRERYHPDDEDRLHPITNHRYLRNLVMEQFKVGYDTAERDIRNTKDYFKNIMDDQEYWRSVYIEQLETRAAKAADKDFIKLIDLAAELRGLKDAPKDDIEYTKLEAFQLIIEYNPEAIGLKRLENPDEVLERWRHKRSVSEKMSEQAEDAKYVI